MLRYYEEQGILTPKRTDTGYRVYSEQDYQTIERVKLLSAAGMTLKTMLLFLPCIRAERPIFEPCDELRTVLQQQISATNSKMKELAKSKAILSEFLTEIENA